MSDALDTAYVEILPDFRKFNRNTRENLNRVSKTIADRLGKAFEGVESSVEDMGETIAKTSTSASKKLSDDIKKSTDKVKTSIKGVERQSKTSFKGVEESSTTAADGVEESATRMERTAGRVFDRLRKRVDDLRTSMAGLGDRLFSIQGRFAGLGALLTVAFVAAVGVVDELGSLLTTLPALAAVAAAGFATLAAVTHGMSDAFAAAFGDADEFAEATEKLAPAARSVAQEFRALVPLIRQIGQEVQEAAFDQLDGQLTAVADNLAGPFRTGLTRAATALGALILGVTAFGQQSETARTVELAFLAVEAVFESMANTIQPLLEGLRILADEFLPRIADAAGPLGQVGQSFKEWAENAVATGEAVADVERALGFLATMGRIAARIGDLLGASFDAAAAAGVDLFRTIEDAIDAAVELAETPRGQAGLEQFFLAVDRIVAALLPIVGQLAVQLGRLADPIADLVEAISPGVKAALEGIADALVALVDSGGREFMEDLSDALVILSPNLGILGGALGSLLKAVSPLLEPVAALIAMLVNFAATIIELISPSIETLAAGIAAILLPVFTAWLMVAQEALPPLIDAFRRLAEASVPLIEQFGGLLLEAMEELMPSAIALTMLAVQGLIFLIDWWIENNEKVIQTLKDVYNWIKDNVVPVIRDELWPVIRDELIPALSDLQDEFKNLWDEIVNLWNEVLELVSVLTEDLDPELDVTRLAFVAVRGAVVLLRLWMSHLVDVIKVITRVLQPMIRMWATAVQGAKGLQRAIQTLRGSGVDLLGTIQGIINRGLRVVNVFNGIRQAAQNVANAIGNIPSLPDLGGLGGFFNFFANGGIVTGPTRAVVGEAGPEVIIPLTQPNRARQLVEESGLLNLISGSAMRAAPMASRSNAASSSGASITIERGAVNMVFNALPSDEAQANRMGQAAADGLMNTLAARNARMALRSA